MKMDRALDASYRFCGVLARREARNFYYAFLALARRPAAVDVRTLRISCGTPTTWPTSRRPRPRKPGHSSAWRQELDAALAGRGTTLAGLARSGRYRERDIRSPPTCSMKAIDGVSMDVEPRRFATFDDLADYCYHVASVVGLAACISGAIGRKGEKPNGWPSRAGSPCN